ncbi:MAG: hypothetical protein IPJ71_03125 [Bdellovibrionales bacterium]|nr:hypothetical protein [Bdellovibrionales bacterium]
MIENLIIQNSPIHGMDIDDGGSYSTPGEYLVLREIDFRNIGSGNNNDCLKMSGINRFHIEGGPFENCNMGEAIDMVGCHDSTVTGNLFRNIPQHAVQAKGGSENVLVHGNIFPDIVGHALNFGGSTDPTLIRPITATSEGMWFSTDNANFAGPNSGEAGPELNSIVQQNPNFRNLESGDYRLQTGSRARAAGRALPTPAPGDFTGRS